MRTTLVALLLSLAIAGAATARQLSPKDVPEAVRHACHVKFPAVTTAEWKLKSDKNYEAEFTLGGVEIAAKFDPSGKWLETESAIPRSELSRRVRATIRKDFSGYRIIETQTLQRAGEHRTVFEVHLDNNREIVKALFARNGNLLSQTAKEKTEKKAAK